MNATDFVLGGIASMGAITVTNPLEVVKTRIQLQGELAARGTYVEPYRGLLHSFAIIVKNDGWLGLQKGLVSSLCFQFIQNSLKLGIYNMALTKGYIHNKDGDISFWRGLFFGSLGGTVGAYFSSPFLMIKTQLQSRAVQQIAVGVQHQHTGTFNAVKRIYNKNGIFGLWRGALGSIPRSAIGSAMQLSTFSKMKVLLREWNVVHQKTLNSFCAGFIAGSATSLVVTPPDLIATRLYNQDIDEHGRGITYKGWLDCLVKIFRAEGFAGLYKGFWPNYFRRAPHSTLMLLFFDELLALRNRLTKKRKEAML